MKVSFDLVWRSCAAEMLTWACVSFVATLMCFDASALPDDLGQKQAIGQRIWDIAFTGSALGAATALFLVLGLAGFSSSRRDMFGPSSDGMPPGQVKAFMLVLAGGIAAAVVYTRFLLPHVSPAPALLRGDGVRTTIAVVFGLLASSALHARFFIRAGKLYRRTLRRWGDL